MRFPPLEDVCEAEHAIEQCADGQCLGAMDLISFPRGAQVLIDGAFADTEMLRRLGCGQPPRGAYDAFTLPVGKSRLLPRQADTGDAPCRGQGQSPEHLGNRYHLDGKRFAITDNKSAGAAGQSRKVTGNGIAVAQAVVSPDRQHMAIPLREGHISR